MNKSLIYAATSIALVAIVLAGASLVLKAPEHSDGSFDSAAAIAAAREASQVGMPQNITWSPADYSSSNVSVTLIRKMSDSPARYDLVRTLSEDIPNSGSISWVPATGETGDDIYVQIGCVGATVVAACQSNIVPSPLSPAK